MDGKPLHHHEERHYLFKFEGRLVSRVMPAEGPAGLEPGYEVGAYDFDGHIWHWARDFD